MNAAEAIPVWAAALAGGLVLLGAAISFVGALGLARLRGFYERCHAPGLAQTLGASAIAVACVLVPGHRGEAAAAHYLLIPIFLTVVAPAVLTLLTRATRARQARTASDGAEATGDDKAV